ncbi:hypothetical protein A2446_00350 [Candidatus Roizmanbacteria bacterium RIFOXYC2_FULL_38_9]|uniref:Purine nucleoside phosphorylase n=1 Tax=Candidatus Roizmanbacteria bacterium RIFOXYD1_FULL_38_12 TaxID=1802093 RepID=A0A1F7L063_9BACT|nr:MAG: hypothetical protein A3K47_01865 [Candidatus Roizmanbacteria bacterium RIFOXYA2_FULL_38_14]OGK63526.1 MAG: hypothetical protein A3K27_01865 [Candidatus Roizmanbacteria bacterium RIFOXYA1_FULL_37_12]OGK65372.1 MAG: hypothetical protein A3K38_01865 [Candidatus Roizmanbacteria bacterium RIFOXYB1_FULL_40_23]OGK73519.1 MAG: hypothetical protein A3K52_01865 [Candidatus Roizmanbacteria bacterium RIFOXYD1_FULL_38_12]OGK74596.1 MAG: hypothetical protein A2446_00350 [Candidatus Roizmanbacteria ba
MIYFSPINKTYMSSKLDDISLSMGFTTKVIGDGRVIDNVLSYLRINQVIFKSLIVAEQIHSANVASFDSPMHREVELLPETDGIVTTEKGIAIAVRTADCIPIIYCDLKAGVIAASHNGWRGSLKNISSRVIDIMVERGASKENIVVAIGPGIGACCYDVQDERYYSFLEEFDNDFGAFSIRGGKRHLNLLKLNYEILKRIGIKTDNIDFFPFCTMCNKDLFFSYRRDYKKHPDRFGEMFSFIVRN